MSWLNLQNFLFLNVKEVAIITLTKNMQIQIFLWTFPVCVPNTADNDVMYLTHAESYLPNQERNTVLGIGSASKSM